MTLTKPGPLRWLWYVYGGRLSDRYREWVLQDNTAKGWLVRHVVRVVTTALPVLVGGFVALALLTPMPWWAISLALLAGLSMSLYYTVPLADKLSKARLVKHGLSSEHGPEFGERQRRHGQLSR